jgi:hypothetical protein
VTRARMTRRTGTATASPRRSGGAAGSATPAAGGGAGTTGGAALLPGECNVGTYRDLKKAGSRGDDLTPHHIPSHAYMEAKGVKDYTHAGGICINMEMPKEGGRHRDTDSYGGKPDLTLSPKEVLAAEVEDCRQIYKDAGLYTPEVEKKLQDLIALNKSTFPGVFD